MEKLSNKRQTLPGADCGSDHQLLVATVQLYLKELQKPKVSNMTNKNMNGLQTAL